MTHLIDRERVLRDFNEGLGQIATGPYPPNTRQSNPNIPPLEFSIAKAEALLAEAGHGDQSDAQAHARAADEAQGGSGSG